MYKERFENNVIYNNLVMTVSTSSLYSKKPICEIFNE